MTEAKVYCTMRYPCIYQGVYGSLSKSTACCRCVPASIGQETVSFGKENATHGILLMTDDEVGISETGNEDPTMTIYTCHELSRKEN